MERQRPADMLAIALRDRRDYLGLNQREAAAQIGIANTYLSQLETGKVGLPSGEVRRRLARFLGISHLDLLLMLGEITADEIAETGQSGVIEPDPKDPRVALRDLLDQINWERDPFRSEVAQSMLRTFLDQDQRASRPSTASAETARGGR